LTVHAMQLMDCEYFDNAVCVWFIWFLLCVISAKCGNR